MSRALLTAGAAPKTVAPRLGVVTGVGGEQLKVDFSFLTGSSVLFDAVYIPGGEASVTALVQKDEAREFVREAYKHCKAIAASGEGVDFIATSLVDQIAEIAEIAELEKVAEVEGVVTSRDGAGARIASAFIKAIAKHRHWERENSSE
jgi:catalase